MLRAGRDARPLWLVRPDSNFARTPRCASSAEEPHSTKPANVLPSAPIMPIPHALDPHPNSYVRSLHQAGNVAKITIPPHLAKQLGWRLRDLMLIELMPDNTLRVSKLDLTKERPTVETQNA